MRVKQPITTSYVGTGGAITLATGVTANYSILLSADSPNKSLVTDLAANVAQCENNTKLVRGSFIQMNVNSASAGVANIWFYLNSKGRVTAPTNGFDFNAGPLTEDNIVLREKTILYRRISVSPNESRAYRFRLAHRRNNFLVDGSSIVMVVHNMSGASINYHAYGRLRTLEG